MNTRSTYQRGSAIDYTMNIIIKPDTTVISQQHERTLFNPLKGLKSLGQVLIITLCFFLTSTSVYSQGQPDVSNDSNINWQLRTTNFSFATNNTTHDVQNGINYPTVLVKSAVDNDNTSTQLMQQGYGTEPNEQLCVSWNEDVPSSKSQANILQTKTNSTQTKFDFTIISYDKNADETWGERCKPEEYSCFLCTSRDYLLAGTNGIYNAFHGNKNQWNSRSQGISANGTSVTFQTTWRYTKGGNFGTGALAFGTINSGTKSHINSNRSAPSGASSSMGYSNLYPNAPFTGSPEVFYTFTISGNAKRVTISTDHTQTNFDTEIGLFKQPTSGTFSHITSNDDGGSGTKSLIVADLGPGNYAIAVEGHFSSSKGDFKLSVNAVNATVDPGAITQPQPTPNLLCEGVQFPQINNSSSASPGSSVSNSLGSTVYTWQWDRGGSFDDIPGGSNVATLPSVSSRKMETENIRFRRKVTIGGNVAYTSPVAFSFQNSTVSSGSIAYDPIRKYVRKGYVLEDKIRNVTSGSGSGTITYKWQKKVGLGGSFIDIMDNGSLYTGIELPADKAGPITAETRFLRVALNVCDKAGPTDDDLVIEAIDSVAIISGLISAPPIGAGVGIENVMITATPQSSLYGVETEVTYTDSDGEYEFSNLYVGKEDIMYEIKPLLTDHRIRVAEDLSSDSIKVEELKANPGSLSGVNFVDLTVFTVKGQVYQNFDDPINGIERKGKEGVIIYLDNLPEDTTDINGNYDLVINNPGTVSIRPGFVDESLTKMHDFLPATQSITVLKDEVGVDFEDTSTKSLSLFVGAGCDLPTGPVNLRIYNDEDGPFDETFTTNSVGNLNIDLPARDYKIEYINNTLQLPDPPPYDYQDVNVQYLSSLKLDVAMAFADTSLAYYYKAPLTLEISGVPDLPSCTTGSYSFPALEQASFYPTFDIKVWEGPLGQCALDTGFIDFTDNVADRGLFTVPVSDGVVDFTLVAGDPNIIGPTPTTPGYTKKLFITAQSFVPTHPSVDTMFEFLVEGEKARPANFVTVSPQIPIMILHDPPGDQSFATFSETDIFETILSTSAKKGGVDGGWGKVKLGTEFSVSTGAVVSFGINNAIWGEVGGRHTATKTNTSLTESLISMATTTSYSTSELQDIFIMGDPGDVYVGGAFNFKYALTDIIELNEEICMVEESVNLAVDPDSIVTTFIKTGFGIANTIRELKDLQSINPDSSLYYQNQINVWESTLAANAKRKEQVIQAGRSGQYYDANYTIDGGGIGQTKTTTSTSSTTNSTEFWLELNSEVSAEIGVEIAGNGINGGYFHQFRTDTGSSSDTTTTKSYDISYTLKDDDSVDDISVDVYMDPVYKTPIFHTFSSSTSCPYEGKDPIDKFIVTSTSPQSVSGVQPGDAAEFTFTVTNTGDFTRDYTVKSNSSYNQDAAEIRIGAAAPGDDLPLRLGPNDGPTQVVVRVRNNSNTVFTYSSLRIEIDPECDGAGDISQFSLKQYLEFTAKFASPCSGITLSEPLPGDIVNIADNNSLKILMTDYDKTKLNTVSLEYRKMGQNTWKSSSISLNSASLSDLITGTTRFWDTSQLLEDGAYELRLQVQCDAIVNYSDIVPILVDRQKPEVFGLPNPIDDDYSIADGDVLSVAFNELICSSLGTTPASAIIVDLVNGDTIQTTVTCTGNEVAIVEQGIALGARPASFYRVILNGIEDRQGNPADEYRWVFGVGGFDLESGICLPDLLITNNNTNQDAISSTNYAAQRIASDGTVPDFGTTSYTAEEQITLEGGFEVLSGGDFIGRIANCNTPAPCGSVVSPRGTADAPSEMLRWNVVENDNCVTGIPFASSIPLNSAVEVDVNDFVTPGDASRVNVVLQVTSPNSGGVTDKSIVLTSAGATVDMGTYISANGSLYSVEIVLVYDGSRLVEGTVHMTPTTSS